MQHNDLHLGNAFRRPDGAIAFIDLGDALWTHPLTAARIPLWIMRNRLGLDPDGPEMRRAVDAYLEPWTDRWDRATLRGLLADAERISCLHRAESWRRLQADVPVEPGRRAVPALGAGVAGGCRGARPVRLRRRPLTRVPTFPPGATTFTFAPEMLCREGEGSGIGRES